MADLYDPLVYDAATGAPEGDVEFYLALAREAHAAGLPVLELACGTGRVAIPIAREGVRVVGLDVSPAMLGRAIEKSAGIENARWLDGDMRAFELPERFGLAFIAFRSFQHLLTAAGQLSCLECIHRHLVPGGRLAIHVFNPNLLRIAGWLNGTRRSPERVGADYRHPRTGNRTARWELPSYQPAEQGLEVTFFDEQLDDGGAVISRLYRDLRLRYVFRYEMEHLFARAGFAIESLHGDFHGAAFDDRSMEMVWVVRRPA